MRVSPELMVAYEAAIERAGAKTPKVTVELEFMEALGLVGMIGTACQHPGVGPTATARVAAEVAKKLAGVMAAGDETAKKAILSAFNPEMNEPVEAEPAGKVN